MRPWLGRGAYGEGMMMARRRLGTEPLRRSDLGDFFDEYYTRVFNYAYYKTLDYATADEVTSDVFYHVARSYATFDPQRGTLDNWVFRIARNSLYSFFRKQRDTVDLDAVAEGVVSYEQTFDDPLEDREQLVRSMLSLLDDGDREIIYLKFWEELSNKEIAQQLGMNASTVSTRVNRAAMKIRKSYPDFVLE